MSGTITNFTMFSIQELCNLNSVSYSSDFTTYSGITEIDRITPCQTTTESMHYCSPYNQNTLNGFVKERRETLKINLKRKRKRTMFTTEQIIALEEVFNKRPYINREERTALMKKLLISEKSIKVWFQNRRRLTDKRSKDYRSDSLSSEDMSDTFLDRLTIIESSINHSTDEYGLVRLDNDTMNELVNVINEYLSQEIVHTQPIVNETKVMYEPISPVSLNENSEDNYVTPQIVTLSSEQVTDLESLLFY